MTELKTIFRLSDNTFTTFIGKESIEIGNIMYLEEINWKNLINNEKYTFSINSGKIENTFIVSYKNNNFILDKTKNIFTLTTLIEEEEEEETTEEHDLKMQTGIFDWTPQHPKLSEDECFYSTKCLDPF